MTKHENAAKRENALLAHVRAIELAVDGLNTKGYKQQKNTQAVLDRIKSHCREALESAPARKP